MSYPDEGSWLDVAHQKEQARRQADNLRMELDAERTAHKSDNKYLVEKYRAYEAVLEKAATSKRPDGTYNFSREAIEQLAKDVLEEWQLKF